MRYRLRDIHLRDALIVGIPVLALIFAGFWYAAQFIKPAPPKRIVIATGGEGGAYQRFGAAYRPLVERFGIEVVELPSAGAVENPPGCATAARSSTSRSCRADRRRRGQSGAFRSAASFEPPGVLPRQRRARQPRPAAGQADRDRRGGWRDRASSASISSRRAERRPRRRGSCRSAGSTRSRRSRPGRWTRSLSSGRRTRERCGCRSSPPASG
jgi:hypothetical protein